MQQCSSALSQVFSRRITVKRRCAAPPNNPNNPIRQSQPLRPCRLSYSSRLSLLYCRPLVTSATALLATSREHCNSGATLSYLFTQHIHFYSVHLAPHRSLYHCWRNDVSLTIDSRWLSRTHNWTDIKLQSWRKTFSPPWKSRIAPLHMQTNSPSIILHHCRTTAATIRTTRHTTLIALLSTDSLPLFFFSTHYDWWLHCEFHPRLPSYLLLTTSCEFAPLTRFAPVVTHNERRTRDRQTIRTTEKQRYFTHFIMLTPLAHQPWWSTTRSSIQLEQRFGLSNYDPQRFLKYRSAWWHSFYFRTNPFDSYCYSSIDYSTHFIMILINTIHYGWFDSVIQPDYLWPQHSNTSWHSNIWN